MNIIDTLRSEIYKLHNALPWGACAAQKEAEALLKDEAYKEVLGIINRLDNPSEEKDSDIDKAAKAYEDSLDYYECMSQWPQVGFKAGAEWMKTRTQDTSRWIPVTESLPPVDEEVIVLSSILHGKPVSHYICFGHIVDRRYCVDYDGWNFPGVTHWMPCPKFPEDESK